MVKFQFQWSNGTEVVDGKDYIDACHRFKTNPDKIITGWLVRIKQLTDTTKQEWRYWDSEMFWKHLKKVKR